MKEKARKIAGRSHAARGHVGLGLRFWWPRTEAVRESFQEETETFV